MHAYSTFESKLPPFLFLQYVPMSPLSPLNFMCSLLLFSFSNLVSSESIWCILYVHGCGTISWSMDSLHPWRKVTVPLPLARDRTSWSPPRSVLGFWQAWASTELCLQSQPLWVITLMSRKYSFATDICVLCLLQSFHLLWLSEGSWCSVDVPFRPEHSGLLFSACWLVAGLWWEASLMRLSDALTCEYKDKISWIWVEKRLSG